MGGRGSGRRGGDGRSWKAGFPSNPDRPIAKAFDVAGLSEPQRELLILHIDRAVGVHRGRGMKIAASVSLMRFGLIRGEVPGVIRPKYTVLTDAGRAAVATLLAQYADALVRAGCLDHAPELRPLQILRRLRAGAAASIDPEQSALPSRNL